MTKFEYAVLSIMVIVFIIASILVSLGAIIAIIDKRGYFIRQPKKKESVEKTVSNKNPTLFRHINIFIANGPMYNTDIIHEKNNFFKDHEKKYNCPYVAAAHNDPIDYEFDKSRYDDFCNACQVGMKIDIFKTEVEILDWLRDNIFNAEIFIINPTGFDKDSVNNLIKNISNFLDSSKCTANKKVYIIAENSYSYNTNGHIKIYARTEGVNTIATIINAAKFAFEELIMDITDNIKKYGSINGYVLQRIVKG